MIVAKWSKDKGFEKVEEEKKNTKTFTIKHREQPKPETKTFTVKTETVETEPIIINLEKE